MKSAEKMRAKELYRQLRGLPWATLWGEEAARFNTGSAEERESGVAVIRAVGVVFGESGPAGDKEAVRQWLGNLLKDPSERVRRYAMAALPKIGAGVEEEQKLLSVWQAATEPREKKHLARTLGRVGGRATLEQELQPAVEQKIKAGLARREAPSALRVDNPLAEFQDLRISLRGRAGLEGLVAEEVEESSRQGGKFRVIEIASERVTMAAAAPFTLTDIYALRCFRAASFVLGLAEGVDGPEASESLAEVIASPVARRLFEALTTGAVRYRLNFASKGHQRAAVGDLAARVYARYPEILNDARSVTWTVDIFPEKNGHLVELRPNMTPDPRFSYREKDVPASSHPPLAACLARLAGRAEGEVVWDPFCGAGSELVERALLGGVRKIFGSDLSADAVRIAQSNFAAAKASGVPAEFIRGSFTDAGLAQRVRGQGVTLIITNPPMGMRVPVADLRRLISDLFATAVKTLKPGGRLALVNPLSTPPTHAKLKLASRQKVDLGGFEGWMEKYLLV